MQAQMGKTVRRRMKGAELTGDQGCGNGPGTEKCKAPERIHMKRAQETVVAYAGTVAGKFDRIMVA